MAEPMARIEWQTQSATAEQARAQARLLAQLAACEPALTEGLQLLRLCSEAGLLQLANALVQEREGLLEILVEQADRPGGALFLKNIVALVQVLGQLPPALWTHLQAGLQAASAAAQRPETGKPGLRLYWQALRNPDVAAGARVALALLRGLGASARALAQPGGRLEELRPHPED
ncbi:MAG: DUF1641 domain-containing protein [Alicyclobacillus sp.]|nr:DUF1641 domain-containing protein [Alicyclobacillus sp.]